MRNFEVDLSGRVALVTGGSRGLGEAMSRGLAAAGADVVVASRDLARCEAVAENVRKAGGRAMAAAADVAEPATLDALLDVVYAAHGRLDLLVNNAGINIGFRPLADVSIEDFDRMVAVNLRGPWYLASRAAPRMAEHGGGSIVNVISVGGLRPPGFLGPYAATKSGLHALTKVMAQEWGPLGIRVNAIAPGSYHSDLFDSTAKALPGFEDGAREASVMKRIADSDEILGPLLYLASEAASFTTGATLVADGGFLTL